MRLDVPKNLYFDDPYVKEFSSRVAAVDGNLVELEDTYFFPQGGGQTGDTGTIGGEKVVNVVAKDGRILHVMENATAFHVGDSVKCAIDWEKRYRKMRLHSASHIVYYLMREVFGEGCDIASSGLLDENKERSDYLFNGPLDKARLKEVEDRANALIAEGHDIKAYRDPADPSVLNWELGSWKMQCCGTHPKNTREIGRIQLSRGKKPGKGRERIEISLA
ncbi:alanyl-tRNA editing protein [Methanocella conradii]|uniref:alanyl-tRNA editing protein n=1 Tax=Methanocella conradii TaxID=1175444 RepID=UPI0024B3A141|nr:alanyl-tRNA editing protein [Methanocella conradii]MDI6896393.1 alanyl-tRNA editing protein [Methanocella conradii]